MTAIIELDLHSDDAMYSVPHLHETASDAS